jgi:hypothetical protein
MPTIIMTPIRDMMFTVVPVMSNRRITPVKPGGTASRIRNGSFTEANCAIRIK